MKKYYCKGDNEPLEFGCKIGFNIVKDEDGKPIEKHIETTFTKDSIPFLKELDVIEEREDTIDFTDDDNKKEAILADVVANLVDTTAILSQKVVELSKRVEALEKDNNTEDSDKVYITLNDYLKRHENAAGSDFDVDTIKIKLNDIIDIINPTGDWLYNQYKVTY